MDVEKRLDVDILVLTISCILFIISLFINGLVIAIILASEKITRNALVILFLCASHIELIVSVLLVNAFHSDEEFRSTALFTPYNSSTVNATQDVVHQANTSWRCNLTPILICLEVSSQLWSCISVFNLTLNQYLYIDAPFWYETYVQPKAMITYLFLMFPLSHLLGFTPLIIGRLSSVMCKANSEVQAGIVLGTTLLLLLGVVILCVRMLVLAQSHKKKMLEYNNITLATSDSSRFFILLTLGYIISYLIPATVHLTVDILDTDLHLKKVNTLFLIGALWFALLYGSRFPKGFRASVRMAICCCLPPPDDPEEAPAIENVMKFTMMRLGQVMVKIDEQAARKRYNTFIERKSRLQKTISGFKKQERGKNRHRYGKDRCRSTPEILSKEYEYRENGTEHQKVSMTVSEMSPLSTGKVNKSYIVDNRYIWPLPSLQLQQAEVTNNMSRPSTSPALRQHDTRSMTSIIEELEDEIETVEEKETKRQQQ